MVDKPLVFIIVLNYNGRRYLEECLSSIKLQTYPNYKIIVFDNASKDSSVTYVKSAFPSVILLQSERSRCRDGHQRFRRNGKAGRNRLTHHRDHNERASGAPPGAGIPRPHSGREGESCGRRFARAALPL